MRTGKHLTLTPLHARGASDKLQFLQPPRYARPHPRATLSERRSKSQSVRPQPPRAQGRPVSSFSYVPTDPATPTRGDQVHGIRTFFQRGPLLAKASGKTKGAATDGTPAPSRHINL